MSLERRPAPALTIRQTHLTTLIGKCPRSAYALAVEELEGPEYAGADRGSAVHEIFADYNRRLATTGASTDWAYLDRFVPQILAAHPELDQAAQDDVRAQAETIKGSYLFDASHFYGAEEALSCDLELGDGRVVRITGTLDLLLVDSDEQVATIRDAKSNHRLPPDSEIRRDLQLTIYALLVSEALPQVETIRGELWFTRYGFLLPRHDEAIWTREDLEAFKAYLRPVLARFLDYPIREAIPGSHCQYCPLRRLGRCTMYRSYYGTTPPPIGSEIQARKIARRVIAQEELAKIEKARLKDWVNAHGPLSVGAGEYGEIWDFRHSESEEIPASELLELLEENRTLVGDQPLDKLLRVDARSKAYRDLRYHRDLKGLFDDRVRVVPGASIFGHKRPGGGDDE